MPLKGHCLCGRIQLTVADSSLPLVPLACHCNNCRLTSGSTTSYVAVVPLSDLRIEGEPKEYRDSATLSGNTTSRYFCPDCGSPVHTRGPSRPGKTVVKMGMFALTLPPVAAATAKADADAEGAAADDAVAGGGWGKPAAEIFGRNRHHWQKPVEGAAQHETLATGTPAPSK